MQSYPHWLEELVPSESLDLLRDLAMSHTPETGSHRLRLETLIRKGDFLGLCEYELNYKEPGLTAHAVMHIRQVTALFSKLKHLDVGVDRRSKAVLKFLEAEARCKETNEVFRAYRNGLFRFEKDVDAVLHEARRKVHKVLGPCPSIDMLSFRFGPGATRGVRRKDASPRAKLREGIQCSETLFPYIKTILGEMPHWANDLSAYTVEMDEEEIRVWDVQIVDAKLTFQPKNATNLRGACTEPGVNVLGQLAIGDLMASRMKLHGIDIHDQTRNQRRARSGSMVNGVEATIDLVSASDMQAFELVAELVSLEWLALFQAFRTPTVILPDGSVIRQEKMSSMGNGFTFPLETLIFWALASSCCQSDSDASVYGDDIIVPISAVSLLYRVLTAAGFEVNRKKSFHDGPFRESCGADYFHGINVRPYYQKEWVSARTLFVLHNFYVRQCDEQRAAMVRSWIHPTLIKFGPDGYGDGHLIGEHPKKVKNAHRARGYGGYLFSTYSLKPRKEEAEGGQPPDTMTLALYSIYRRACDREVVRPRQEYGVSQDLQWFKGGSEIGDIPYFSRGANLVDIDLEFAPLPLDETSPAEGERQKRLTLPGDEGYKSTDIYTFGD